MFLTSPGVCLPRGVVRAYPGVWALPYTACTVPGTVTRYSIIQYRVPGLDASNAQVILNRDMYSAG